MATPPLEFGDAVVGADTPMDLGLVEVGIGTAGLMARSTWISPTIWTILVDAGLGKSNFRSFALRDGMPRPFWLPGPF